jgi:hypothetical protein
MTKASEFDIRVYLTLEDSSSFGTDRYLHVNASIVHLVWEDGRQHVRSPSSDFYSNPLAGLADLGMRGQMSSYNGHTDYEDFYAMVPAYHNVHSAGLGQLEVMTKTLRGITRKMDAMNTADGDAIDTAQKLARFARAIGAAKTNPFVWVNTPKRYEMTGDKWTTMNVDNVRAHLRHEISEWKTRHNLTPESVEA